MRWRQVVALCAASLALHYAAVDWVGAQLAEPGRNGPIEAAPIVAQLHAADAPALPAAAPSVVEQRPVTVVAKAGSGSGAHARTGYKVKLPPPAELAFDLLRTEEGGAWPGQGVIDWQREGAAYRIRMQAGLARDGAMALWELASEGTVGDGGITPRTAMEKRRGRAPVAVHFNPAQRQITFSASSQRVVMQPGAQDVASFGLQLSAIANADSAQLAKGVLMQVAGGREAQPVRFVLAGEETVDTGMGRVRTWRVQRLMAPGSYNAQLEIWLAPDYHWYPVQLRSTEANGTVTTQTIRRIVIKEN